MSVSSTRPVTVEDITESLQRHENVITTHAVVMHDDLGRSFNLPVGPCEALGIKVWLKNDLVIRPLTHDLIHSVLGRLGGEVEYVLIRREANGWKASVALRTAEGTRILEANHGDAIAIALRANATILATEDVIVSVD